MSPPDVQHAPVPASTDPPSLEALRWGLPNVSISALGELAGIVIQDVAVQAGVSVVVPDLVAAKAITLELVDAEAQRAFEEIGASVGHTPRYQNGVVSFVPKGAGVREYAVVRTAFESPEAVGRAMAATLGSDVATVAFGDRVLVAGDREQIEAAKHLAKQFTVGSDGWLLEVRLVAVTKQFSRDLGLEWGVTGGLDVRMDAGTGNLGGAGVPVFGARAQAAVSLIAQAAEEGRTARLLRSGRLMLLEGAEPARMQQGDVVPVPRRTVSDQGTVTVTGYDQVNTGFVLAASARRVPGGVRLELAPSISTVTGFVEGAPITSQSSVSASCMVASGEWIVLSGLDATDLTERSKGVPGIPASMFNGGEHFDARASSVLVLVQAIRASSAEKMRSTP